MVSGERKGGQVVPERGECVVRSGQHGKTELEFFHPITSPNTKIPISTHNHNTLVYASKIGQFESLILVKILCTRFKKKPLVKIPYK